VTTLGFDHSKLRFMYNADSTRKKLQDMVAALQPDHELFFIEGGRDMVFGSSVYLDPISVARATEASLLLVASGDHGTMADELAFLKHRLQAEDVNFVGLVVNGERDVTEFRDTQVPILKEMEIPLLGVLPYQPGLHEYPVAYLAENLFATVIAGEAGLQRTVRQTFVATMGLDMARKHPEFARKDSLVIVSGDRSDIVVAALEGGVAGVMLTDDVMPGPNIVSKATSVGVPLLQVRQSTATAARRIEELDPLITRDDEAKVATVTELVSEHLNLGFLEE